MYQIYYNDTLLYDPRGANTAEPGDRTFALVDGRLQLAVDSAGRLTMTLAAGHPAIGQIVPRLGVVKVVELIGSNAETVFLGRVIRETLNLDNSHSYEVEGRLACLNDTIMLPHSLPEDYASDSGYQAAVAANTVPSWWLGKLLETHNGMAVTDNNRIQPGTVTVTGGAMARSADDYRSMWETIREELPNSPLGGHLVVRYAGDTAYLDYLAELTDENAQHVVFGENLLDLSRSTNAEDYYNSIIPIGKDGMRCSAAPNGYQDAAHTYFKSGPYVINSPQSNGGYGCVFRTVSWPEVTDPQELVDRAVAMLAAAVFIDEIQISAADLSLIGTETAAFRIARILIIEDPPQGIRQGYAVMCLDIDLTGGVETRLTLGTRGVSLTGR